MPQRRLLLLAALALGSGTAPSAMASSPPPPLALTCQLSVQAVAPTHTRLQFTLRNAGPQPVRVLRWGSPFENGWFSPFVRVLGPQGELPYQGAMKKRAEPRASDYLRLRPGQTVTAQVRLEDAFDLSALPPGELVIRAHWRWHDAHPDRGTMAPRPREQHEGLEQDCGEQRWRR